MWLAAEQPDLFYARQQMALSLGWHIIIASMGIGFPVLVLLAEWRGQRTGDEVFMQLARRWGKALGVLFAVGAVSGTILSFEFGILWPRWMERFGDIMGLPFALEGIAFFIEAIFLGIYLYGWDRLSPRAHLLSGLPIPIAGVASAFFVVAANGWMNDPTGFRLDSNGNPVDINPWAAMFNSSLWPQATHMILAAFMVSGFMVATVYAWKIIRGNATRYHRIGFAIAFSMAAIFTPIQIGVGDWAARYIAQKQPLKLAAAEGHYKTENRAPLYIGGYYDEKTGSIKGGIKIPGGLSFLAFRDPDARVVGLEEAPKNDRPPVNVVRFSFQIMVGIGFGLLGIAAWFGVVSWRRKRLPRSKWFYWFAWCAGPAAVIALEAGWITTEVGRQPWITYEVMRVEDAVTDAPGIRYGYFALIIVYVLLTIGTVFVLRRLRQIEPRS